MGTLQLVMGNQCYVSHYHEYPILPVTFSCLRRALLNQHGNFIECLGLEGFLAATWVELDGSAEIQWHAFLLFLVKQLTFLYSPFVGFFGRILQFQLCIGIDFIMAHGYSIHGQKLMVICLKYGQKMSEIWIPRPSVCNPHKKNAKRIEIMLYNVYPFLWVFGGLGMSRKRWFGNDKSCTFS